MLRMKSFRSKVMGKRQKDLLNDVSESHPASIAGSEADSNSVQGEVHGEEGETRESVAARLITTFCKSLVEEGPDVALLPSIVEVAESSPATAAECARRIRKHLYKENWQQPTSVYNAIMLIRILVENPGNTFTRCMDKKFVDATRDVLRHCPHMQVVHFLTEALQDFEYKLATDEGLTRIVEMWLKEKNKIKPPHPARAATQPMQSAPALPPTQPPSTMPMQPMQPMPGFGQFAWQAGSGSNSHGGHSSTALPRPKDVRKRLEEALTTASVLADVVNTSSPEALLDQDLMGDLSTRCRRASSQILDFLSAQQPSPDNFEIQHLLDAHVVVHEALQHYYRAVLEARKRLNVGETRRSETTGAVSLEMTSANKGKGAAPASPGGPDSPGGPSMSGASNDIGHNYEDRERSRSNGKSAERGINGDHGNHSSHGAHGTHGNHATDQEDLYSADDDDYGRGRNQDNERAMEQDMAAAIAASTAPGASSRPLHRYDTGPEDPFGDGAAGSSSASGARGGGYAGAFNEDNVSPLEMEDSRAPGKGTAAVYRY